MNSLYRHRIAKRTYTLFEHDRVSYEALGIGPESGCLTELEELNKAAELEFIELERTALKATQFVGVIVTSELTLQILPKIDSEGSSEPGVSKTEREHAKTSATRNLLRLLSYTEDLKVREQQIASLTSAKGDWLEVMTRLFASDLHAHVKRGMSRAYLRVEETLPVLRGRWQLPRQLMKRPYVKHLFDVTYDEFSEDTPLNRVLKYVVERLLVRSRDAVTRRLLRELSEMMVEITPVAAVTRDDLQRVESGFTRLNDHYRVAFNLARMFIENEVLQLRLGAVDAYALLFDMNVLFEEFVARFIELHREKILTGDLADTRIERQRRKRPAYLAKSLDDGRDKFLLKPDLTFVSETAGNLLVADTKYKKIEGAKGKGIFSSDAYQMLAYAIRFRCHAVIMIYPRQKNEPQSRLKYELYETDVGLFVATIDLHTSLEDTATLIEELKDILGYAVRVSTGEVTHG